MKSSILLIVFCLCGICSFAQDLTESQKRIRSEIFLFLKEEGYMPDIDQDGDIKFKKEGNTYYISISKEESPYYLSFFREFSYPESYSVDVVKLAAAELNFYKGVKLLCYKNRYRIQAEMYFHEADAFKYVFYKLTKQIINVYNDFLDECAKVPSSYNKKTSLNGTLVYAPSINFNINLL